MCGIACIISNESQSYRERVIDKILTGITHRGRDGTGIKSLNFIENQTGVTLGHRRLSVIDLYSRADQPFVSQCKKIILSFNGEIYNYREIRKNIISRGYSFETESDTEVIVAGYLFFGQRIFEMLEGMFAFVLLSVPENIIYIGRDYFGVKPVYYYESNKNVIICSESKAISSIVSSSPDIDKLRAVASFGYNVGYSSVYKKIKKVPQGTVMKYNIILSRWDNFKIKCNNISKLADTKIHSVEQHLHRSIEAQTVSDIGFGVFLSGGIDSGLITNILHRKGHRFPVFTAGNINEKGSDASRANLLADRLHLPLYNVDIDVKQIPEILWNTYSHLTEPILDSSLVYSNLLSNLASSENIKVILSGAGGDELFFGYSRYQTSNISRLIFRNIPLKVRRLLSNIISTLPLKYRLRFPSLDFAMQIAGSISTIKNIPLSYLETNDFKDFDKIYNTTIESQNEYDNDVYLTENILLGFDQTTMMHTVEGRVPFLDRGLYGATRKISRKNHMPGGRLKSILKDIATNYLPNEYLIAPKQGFSGPVTAWVKNNEKYFRNYSTKALESIDVKYMKQPVNKFVNELSPYDQFNLTALQVWIESN